MAIQFEWHIPEQVAIATLSGSITTEDLKSGNQIMTQWLDESTAWMVHIVFDATDMKTISFSALETIHMLRYLKHPRMGCFVVFGGPRYLDPIVRFLGGIINQLTNAQFSMASDLKTALSTIVSVDNTVITPVQ